MGWTKLNVLRPDDALGGDVYLPPLASGTSLWRPRRHCAHRASSSLTTGSGPFCGALQRKGSEAFANAHLDHHRGARPKSGLVGEDPWAVPNLSSAYLAQTSRTWSPAARSPSPPAIMELNGLQEEQEEIVGYESPMAPKVKRTSSTIGSLSSSLRVGLAKLWRASLRAKSSRRGVAGAPVDADDFTAARPEMAEVFKTLSLSPVPSTRRGLVNLGQSCWMAAVLQCLATVRPLVAYLRESSRGASNDRGRSSATDRAAMRHALAKTLVELVKADEASSVMCGDFRIKFIQTVPSLDGNGQHDAHEFLTCLLSRLQEWRHGDAKQAQITQLPALERLHPGVAAGLAWEQHVATHDPVIAEVFGGQLRNVVECLRCGETSVSYSTFDTLSVPIPASKATPTVNLERCLGVYFKEEMLRGANAWFCPHCKSLQASSKRVTLARVPRVLVIHLNRFAFGLHAADKTDTPINFPVDELDLGPLLRRDSDSTASGNLVQRLLAYVEHHGGLESGHYTATVRGRQGWHTLDDEAVMQGPNDETEWRRHQASAYLLFYGAMVDTSS